MRFHQINEQSKVTAQDVFDTVIKIYGDKLRTADYFTPAQLKAAKEQLGIRVLPVEFRNAMDSHRFVTLANLEGVVKDKQTQPTVAKPAAFEKPTPQAPKVDETKAALSALKAELKRSGKQWSEYRDGDNSLEVRDWGTWEVPEGEEDDGDYDWEVLTSSSAEKLGEIIGKINKEFNSVEVSYQVGEKNWLYFNVKKK